MGRYVGTRMIAAPIDTVFVNPVMRRQVEREMKLMAAQFEAEPDLQARRARRSARDR